MYCTRCGKQIDYDAVICRECQKELIKQEGVLENQSARETVLTKPQNKPVKLSGKVTDDIGFGAVTLLMSVVAIILAIFAIYFFDKSIVRPSKPLFSSDDLNQAYRTLAIIFTLFSICVGLLSLLPGVKSIKLFASARNRGCVRPVPGFVLGITGISILPTTLIFCIDVLLALML